MHRRLPTLLLCFLAAFVPVAGLFIGFGSAAGASTPGTHASPGARAAAAARAALKQLAIGQHAADHRASGQTRRIKGVTQVRSTNWSGYADVSSGGHTYSKVTGSWTEPSVSCGLQTSLAAFWVGIDGYSSSSVEQDGTLAECYLGSAYYYTWWEMYPSNSVQVVGGSLTPGDNIRSSVVKSGTNYTLTVTDSTHPANSFSTVQRCSNCANSSAEWIAEAPSGSTGVYPLADFRSWTETGATVTSGSTSKVISTFPDAELTMVDSAGLTKALPGALNSSGNGFKVTWERSS
jgi:hypothetical protein